LKKVLIGAVTLAIALVVLGVIRKSNAPPHVAFAKATRGTISNQLSTNGKVEPSEYIDVRVDSPALVKSVRVHNGDTVRKGEILAELSEPGLDQELAAATAREAQARAGMQTAEAGGPSSGLAEIDAGLNRLRNDRDAAERNFESLQRLQQKQAAAPYDVEQARQAVASLDVQIRSLEKRRSALVGKGDLADLEAKLREAQANVQRAKDSIARDTITAPMDGTIYDLPARAGSYLTAGAPVASIGKLNPVRVRVYVDEPELGRVAVGAHVRITWDALPGKEWTGVVEKRPTEIVALGTRQVGEVLCTIDNPMRELLPGTNVNAFILTQVIESALTVPKTAIRRENGTGVYVLGQDGAVRWQAVTLGASDALRVEVSSGLSEGDAVAESPDQSLKNGEKVQPVLR
jgi:multidrug efflux pump subunit AcrA (membrane-fusion protein)